MVNTIASVIRHKTEVFFVPSTASVYEAIERMASKGIGALLVMDEGRLVGVVSERDTTPTPCGPIVNIRSWLHATSLREPTRNRCTT